MELNNFIVIDTETSGLFRFKDEAGKAVPADDPSQPHLASLAVITLGDFGEAVDRRLFLISPDGWEMDPAATAVNGLTTEQLWAEGVPVAEALDFYERKIRQGYAVAAFNAQFDCKALRAAFRRAGRDDLFTITRNTCLMRAAQGLADYGFKSATRGWPKLAEVAEYLGLPAYDAHEAMADAETARLVLIELNRRGLLIPPAVHFAKGK